MKLIKTPEIEYGISMNFIGGDRNKIWSVSKAEKINDKIISIKQIKKFATELEARQELERINNI
jgi:hypothetical protein